MNQPADYTLTPLEFARLVGVSASTIRRWEDEGIYHSERQLDNTRRYSLKDLEVANKHKDAVAAKKVASSRSHIYQKMEVGDQLSEVGSDKLMHVHQAEPIIVAGEHQASPYALGYNRRVWTGLASFLTVALLGTSIYFLTSGKLPENVNVDATISSLRSFSGQLSPRLSSLLSFSEKIMPRNFYPGTKSETINDKSHVLAATAAKNKQLTISIPTIFKADIEASGQDLNLGTGQITASNVIYDLVAGTGISVTEGQTPTIGNTGVLSIGGQTGELILEAGAGIKVDGLKVTNDDRGSAQNIFKSIEVSGSTLTAGSNNDSFKLLATGDTTVNLSGKEITINTPVKWTQSGNLLYPTTITNYVGIGTKTPTSLLSVGTTSGFQVNAAGDIVSINTIAYEFPDAQGAANAILTNNGAGSLTWAGLNSLNGITGTGTSTYIPKFDAAHNIIDSHLYEDTNLVLSGVNFGINQVNPTYSLDVTGTQRVTGAVSLGSTLGVTGAATLSSTLGVTGLSTLHGINNSSNGISQAGAITGATGITSSGTITFSGLGAGVIRSSVGGVLSNGAVNLASEVSGTLPTTNGGTGLTSYSPGDMLYANDAGALVNLGVGDVDNILIVNAQLKPTWGMVPEISGELCTNCLLNNPASTQYITPTQVSATGLAVKQASGGNVDVFRVTSFAGDNYFSVNSSGNTVATGTLTVSPADTDNIVISPVAAGAGAFAGTLSSENLTQARQWYLPNRTGNICVDTGNCAGLSGSIGGSGTPGYLAMYADTYMITNSQLFDDGTNVGIGDITPSYKLDVNGTFRATGDAAFNSDLAVTGDSTLTGGLDVTGASVLRSTLNVIGAATLSSTLGVTGLATFDSGFDSNSLSTIDYNGSGTALAVTQAGSGNAATFMGGKVGIGVVDPDSTLEILGTATQLKLSYNGTYYTSLTVDSAGMLTVAPNGTAAATFSDVANTFSLPTSFTAVGDVSVAYDLAMVNQNASSLKSLAPLTIDVGENFESNPLTLRTYNSGQLVLDLAGGALLNQAQNWTLASSTNALTFKDASANSIFNIDSTNDRVGIGTITPAAKLDVTSTSTTGGDFLLTNTGVGLSGTLAGITANSVTTGDILTLSSTGLTTGSALVLTGPSTTGVTDHFVKLTSDIGSASSLLSLAPDFSGSAVTAYGLNIAATDATATANTDYAAYRSLALTGNAAKVGYADYSTITSSSTTADTTYGGYFNTSLTGAVAAGTQNTYGVYGRATTANLAGATSNVYGGYFKADGTVASGTLNSYGLYVANGTMNATGTTTNTGLYVETPSGADYNYAAIFQGGNVGIGTTSPAKTLDVQNGIRLRQSSNASSASLLEFTNRNAAWAQGFTWNSYYDGASWKRRTADYPALYSFSNTGDMTYATSGTGAADSTITWITPFKWWNSGGTAWGKTFNATDPGANNMIIEGNVGIGTTGPGDKLSISGGKISVDQANAGQTTFLKVRNTNGALNDTADLDFAITSGAVIMGRVGLIRTNAVTSGDTDMTFSTYRAGTSPYLIEAMRIQSSGNVGIGVIDPDSKLEIYGTSSQFKISYDATYYTAMTVDSTGMLTVAPNGTTAATFSDVANTFSLPTSFTAAGDVSLSYDLAFTNATASFIKSDGPLTIQSGNEAYQNLDLTLDPSGTGAVVIADGSNLDLYSDHNFVFDTDNGADSYLSYISASSRLALFTDATEVARFNADGSIDANGAVNASAFDLAENYPTMDTSLEPGDIVALAEAASVVNAESDLGYLVGRAGDTNKGSVLGVVSTKPGVLLGGSSFQSDLCQEVNSGTGSEAAIRERLVGANQDSPKAASDSATLSAINDKINACKALKQVPIALSGRVPVKVELTTSAIKAGDMLTASTVVPGKAAKATEPGWVIGRALEDAESGKTTIMALVSVTWYGGEAPLGHLSNLSNLGNLTSDLKLDQNVVAYKNLNVLGKTTLSDLAVTGAINNGLLQIDGLDPKGGASLNVLDGKLALQPTGLGNVEFFGGKLAISSDGSLATTGRIEAKEVIAQEFKVKAASDFVGSPLVGDRNTAGKATLLAGSTSLVIPTTAVDQNSLIFITPEVATTKTLAVTKKISGSSFTIEISSPEAKNIPFSWLIVGVEP